MSPARRAVVASALLAGAACSGSQRGKPADSTPVTKDSASAPRADSATSATPTPPVTAAPGTPMPATPTPASQSPATQTVQPSETVMTGKVIAGGLAATPMTQLQIEGGKPTALVGALEPELRRLGGAMVWVTGAPVATQPNATFMVTRYEIVSIDGAKPLVGLLVSRAGAVWLATERDTVKLLSAPAELARKAGAKVWVIGRRSGADVTTQSYGVIREP